MSSTSEFPATRSATPVLPDALRLGAVHLTVRDLERSVRFYEQAIGLREVARSEGQADLAGTPGGEPVLVLEELPDARPAGRHAGLYHVALLYPSRLELARVGKRLVATQTPIEGASDHGTHEAFYLPDPDGNGLELAADRPRAEWKPYDLDGVGPRPLDLPGLMALVADEDVQHDVDGAIGVGHLHVHVGDLDAARAFYVDAIGFEEQFAFDTASFVSAGGYHHHLGMNLWRGRNVPPAPAHALGLRRWTVVLPSAGDVTALAGRLRDAGIAFEEDAGGSVLVRDPWEMLLHVRAGELTPANMECMEEPLFSHPDIQVRQSGDWGYGVFTDAFIPAGACIQECHYLLIPRDDSLRNNLRDYVFGIELEEEDEGVEQVAVVLGYGMIFNHSEDPNVSYSIPEDVDAFRYEALRDIEPGEQLCIDYGEEWWPDRGQEPAAEG